MVCVRTGQRGDASRSKGQLLRSTQQRSWQPATREALLSEGESSGIVKRSGFVRTQLGASETRAFEA